MTQTNSEQQHAKANEQVKRDHEGPQKQANVPNTRPTVEQPLPQGPENPDLQTKPGQA